MLLSPQAESPAPADVGPTRFVKPPLWSGGFVRPGDWTDGARWTVLSGLVLDRIRRVPDSIVDMHLYSPPYYKLRDYGPGQMGNEETPDLYVEGQVEFLREAKRTAADHATIWCVIQDKRENGSFYGVHSDISHHARKTLGLLLVNEVIWGKDACLSHAGGRGLTLAHEHILVFAKSESYYWNALMSREYGGRGMERVARSVQFFKRRKEAWQKSHDAVFPVDLVRFALRCGATPHGRCRCGSPVEDVITRKAREAEEIRLRCVAKREVVGVAPRCGHEGDFEPILVMDAFCGTATTGMVGLPHGNVRFLGIENNEEHIKTATRNLSTISPGGLVY